MAITNHIRAYPNMERSIFRLNEYVGWDKRGQRYAIKRVSKKEWQAVGQDGKTLYAAQLYQLSAKLAA